MFKKQIPKVTSTVEFEVAFSVGRILWQNLFWEKEERARIGN